MKGQTLLRVPEVEVKISKADQLCNCANLHLQFDLLPPPVFRHKKEAMVIPRLGLVLEEASILKTCQRFEFSAPKLSPCLRCFDSPHSAVAVIPKTA